MELGGEGEGGENKQTKKKTGTKVKENGEFVEFGSAREHIPRSTPPPRLVRATRSERKGWGPEPPL